MAQYTKRGAKWQARIQWRDSHGKRHTKSKLGFATKSQAKQWAVEVESSLMKGIKLDRSITLYDYWSHWVATYKAPTLSKISLSRYNSFGNLIRQSFGDTKISDISRSQYQEFINDFGQNHAPSTVQKLNGFIRACINSAILDDYLVKDFTQGVALTSDRSRIVKVEYLDQSEIERIINTLTDDLNSNYTSRYMILTAIYTGMRLSEIQALTWSDIDFNKQTIKINKSWDFRTRSFKPTKNESSNRTIRINTELLDILNQLRRPAKGTMLFINQFGTIPTSNAVNKCLRLIMNDLGIKRANLHFHSLRHSHVAILLAKGIDIYAISKRLGHSDVSTTINTYAYLLDEYKQQTDNQIIDALNFGTHTAHKTQPYP